MAGLYIHIPFCLKKCDYCDFVSFPCTEIPDEYVQALIKEIRLSAALVELPHAFDTVFFGGGTPSLLSERQLESVLDALQKGFRIAEDAEVSIECNPGAVTAAQLSAFRKLGVNRLSIGMQSHSDRLLKSIGRIHTGARFFETVDMARQAGFSNINADVMHGLPGQSIGDYLDSLKTLASLELPHVSAYSLILEEHTPLFERVKHGEVTALDEDLTADMQDAGFAFLASQGYERYEISNFAKPGYRCRHNLNYWKNGEYLGLGVAAHSAARTGEWTRWSNVETMKAYCRSLARDRLPRAETLKLFPADEMFECVMLGLRLVEGLERDAFRARFGIGVKEAYPEAFDKLKKRGWLRESDTHVALTPQGMDMQNAALQFFM